MTMKFFASNFENILFEGGILEAVNLLQNADLNEKVEYYKTRDFSKHFSTTGKP